MRIYMGSIFWYIHIVDFKIVINYIKFQDLFY